MAIKVKGQFFRPDIGTFLADVLANYLVKGPVKQMGHGVVPFHGLAAIHIDFDADLSCFQRAWLTLVIVFGDKVKKGLPHLARIQNPEALILCMNHSLVSKLPPHLGIADTAIQHHCLSISLIKRF